MKNMVSANRTFYGKNLFICLLPLVLLAGCMKEKNYRTFTLVRPEYKIKQSVKDAVKLTAAKTLKNLGSFILYNHTMFVSERNEGIHVIDYSNPSSPQNKGFIPLPGNTGIAIKNDMVYADCYSDLFIIKLVSATQVELQDLVSNAFSSRMNVYAYDTSAVEVIWHKKDTTVTETQYKALYSSSLKEDAAGINYVSSTPAPGGGVSLGSSMAVFAIINNFLYTVDQSRLNTFSIADPLHPKLENSQEVNWNVETIFPFKDKLFVGSMTGMFMYGIEDPAKPALIGQFNHARVCDPVVADEKYAYVTLRNGSACGGFLNQIDVINIEDANNSVRVSSFDLVNPHGLSKDGDVLFVCDGAGGLTVMNASDPAKLSIHQNIQTPGNALDVLAFSQLAFVMLDNAIQIYSYDQQFNIQLLGSIAK
jgi:hypothetical protein